MEIYIIRITTIDNLYCDYMVEAGTLIGAVEKAKMAFLRDYPDADRNIQFSLRNPNMKKIKEILISFKKM